MRRPSIEEIIRDNARIMREIKAREPAPDPHHRTCCGLDLGFGEERVSKHQPLRELGVDIEHRDPAYVRFCGNHADQTIVVDGIAITCCGACAMAQREWDEYLAGRRNPNWMKPRQPRWGNPSAAAARDAECRSEDLYRDAKRAILERGEQDVRHRPDALFAWARRTRG